MRKIHLKLRGHAICGQKKHKNPLKFAKDDEPATCKRCIRAASK
jgi:hypothetical protein